MYIGVHRTRHCSIEYIYNDARFPTFRISPQCSLIDLRLEIAKWVFRNTVSDLTDSGKEIDKQVVNRCRYDFLLFTHLSPLQPRLEEIRESSFFHLPRQVMICFTSKLYNGFSSLLCITFS